MVLAPFGMAEDHPAAAGVDDLRRLGIVQHRGMRLRGGPPGQRRGQQQREHEREQA